MSKSYTLELTDTESLYLRIAVNDFAARYTLAHKDDAPAWELLKKVQNALDEKEKEE